MSQIIITTCDVCGESTTKEMSGSPTIQFMMGNGCVIGYKNGSIKAEHVCDACVEKIKNDLLKVIKKYGGER